MADMTEPDHITKKQIVRSMRDPDLTKAAVIQRELDELDAEHTEEQQREEERESQEAWKRMLDDYEHGMEDHPS